MEKIMNKNMVILLIASLALLISSCVTTRNMANVRISNEADEQFFNRELVPNFNYFYYGPDHKPIAFLALDKNYSLESQFWHKTEPTDATLKQWANLFRKSVFFQGSSFRSWEIVSPESESIGLVLSRHHLVTAWFEDKNRNVITIPPPDLTPMQPDRSQEFRDDD
jgi:hypothetical protein